MELLKNYSLILAIASAAMVVAMTIAGFVVPSFTKRVKYASFGLVVFSLFLFVSDIALDAYTGKRLSAYIAQPIFRLFCEVKPNDDCLRRLSNNRSSDAEERIRNLSEALSRAETEFSEGIERLRREVFAPDPSGNLELDSELQKLSISDLEEATAVGDKDAEFVLALKLWLGAEGVERNSARGLSILEKLGEQGVARAQASLGFAYMTGAGVDQNLDSAIQWLRLASDNGSDYATALLGEILLLGRGKSDEDAAEGFELLLQSALNDDRRAQFLVGYAYQKGIGVKQNWPSAATWYKRSAENGFMRAMKALAELYEDEASGMRDLKQSLNWYKKAANLEDPHALHQVGVYHILGWGTEQDGDLGVWYLERAAEQGSVGSQYTLGYLYYIGDPVDQDYKKAASFLKQASGEGLAPAEYLLGTMYENGQGVVQSDEVAVEYFRSAADLGVEKAKLKLASAIAFGKGTESDPEKAVGLFLELAEQGNIEAMAFLASAYKEGFGVEKNDDAANRWTLRAREAASVAPLNGN